MWQPSLPLMTAMPAPQGHGVFHVSLPCSSSPAAMEAQVVTARPQARGHAADEVQTTAAARRARLPHAAVGAAGAKRMDAARMNAVATPPSHTQVLSEEMLLTAPSSPAAGRPPAASEPQDQRQLQAGAAARQQQQQQQQQQHQPGGQHTESKEQQPVNVLSEHSAAAPAPAAHQLHRRGQAPPAPLAPASEAVVGPDVLVGPVSDPPGAHLVAAAQHPVAEEAEHMPAT
jgi:hypothetical protein